MTTKDKLIKLAAVSGAFLIGILTAVIAAIVWPFALSYFVYSNMTDEEEEDED